MEPRLAHLLGLEDWPSRDQDDLFAGWRLFFERMAEQRARRSSCSRTCSGPTRRCSSSSSTCSSGRAAIRSSCSRSPGRSSRSATRAGRPGSATSHALHLEALAGRGDGRAARRASSGPAGRGPRDDRGRARRACRSTPSRRCACCSTAGCSRRTAAATARRGRSGRWTCPRRSRRCSPPASTGSIAEERRMRPGRGRARQDVRAGRRSWRSPSLDEAELGPAARRRWCARRCSRCRPTPARRSAASTASSRTSSEARRIRDARARATARHSTSPRPGTSRTLRRSRARDRRGRRVALRRRVPRGRRTPTTREVLSDRAREMLERAGERAASLAAGEEAKRYFEQAAELADDPLVRARLHERAGEMALARRPGRGGRAPLRPGDRAPRGGRRDTTARRAWPPASARSSGDRAASTRAWRAWSARFAVLEGEEPDAGLRRRSRPSSARLHFFRGDGTAPATARSVALEIAEALWLPEVSGADADHERLERRAARARPSSRSR